MFKTIVFGTLVGTRDRCLLGEPDRRHPFQPGYAPPRLDPPVVCPGFGFGRFIDKALIKIVGGFQDLPYMHALVIRWR